MFISTIIYDSPVGRLLLGSDEDALCVCDWFHRSQRTRIDSRIQSQLNKPYRFYKSDVIKKTIHELESYFCGDRKSFSIPLKFVGTAFQQSVWQALQQIPYGETMSYKELAKYIDKVSAVRAVANANGANALSILVPCHRIIGNNGDLVGYAGGLPAKKKLLELESQLSIFNH